MINEYFTESNLHFNHQHKREQNFSMETLVWMLLDELLSSIETRQISILIALDLSSAFDTVDHSVLEDVLRYDFYISGSAYNVLNVLPS